MTASASSDLGTGFELGGQASGGRVFGGLTFAGQEGPGQARSVMNSTTAWNDGAWSAHPPSATSDDPASASASTAPSFRSSWQSAVDAWNGSGNGCGDNEEETAIAGSVASGSGASAPSLAGRPEATWRSASPATATVGVNTAQTQQTDSTQSAAAGVQTLADKLPVAVGAVQTAIARSAATTSDSSLLGQSAAKAGRTTSTAAPGRLKNKTQHTVSGAQITLAAMPASMTFPTSAPRQASAFSQPGRKGQETIEWSPISGREAILRSPKGIAESGIAAARTAIAAVPQDSNGTLALFPCNTSRNHATQDQTPHEDVATSADEPSIALSEVPLQSGQMARGAMAGEDRSFQAAAVANAHTDSSAASVARPASNATAGAAVGVDRSVETQASTHTASGAVPDPTKPQVLQSVSHAASHDLTRVTGAPPVATFHAPSTDVSTVVALHTSAADHVAAAPAADHTQTVTPAATSAQDTFSSLDTGAPLGNPMWTHAGSHHAEAGFRDPDLGWVGVRAELSASGVHATLVPSSADAAQSLSGHLAGLDMHLTEQHAQVASLSMASPGDGGIGSGAGQQMQQGADRNTQGSPQENLQTHPEGVPARSSSTSAFSPPPQSESPDALSHAGAMRGTRISVVV